jgi:glycosyltransferase involved in cell wall biosynthesis
MPRVPLRLAILGTRGIPASYGGFETFAEQISTRLAARGHEVTVYCRSHHTPRQMRQFDGVRLVVLPSIRHKYLDTFAHAFFSSVHALGGRYDVALYCNAANAPFLLVPRLRGVRTAINVDGLEWKRRKWNALGRAYYRLSERLACRFADRVITDARVIRDYYRETHRAESTFIPYGAPCRKEPGVSALAQFGVEPRRYILYVARLEPENNADKVISAFRRVDSPLRLVIVGDAPYAAAFIRRLRSLADERVIFTGYVFGQAYRELMSHAYCYVHATEVGGTHPALLEAMGLGNGVLVSDVPENREAAADTALLYSLEDPGSLVTAIETALREPERLQALAEAARSRIRNHYSWDAVADEYERILTSLAAAGRPVPSRDGNAPHEA